MFLERSCVVFFTGVSKRLIRGQRWVSSTMPSTSLYHTRTQTDRQTHTHTLPPAFLIRERNLMSCFCGHPITVWGHFSDCFFPRTIVGSARKGALMGYSISSICCFKNTSAPERGGHVLLIGTCSQTWCFLCLGKSLRFNGCCIQRMMGIW